MDGRSIESSDTHVRVRSWYPRESAKNTTQGADQKDGSGHDHRAPRGRRGTAAAAIGGVASDRRRRAGSDDRAIAASSAAATRPWRRRGCAVTMPAHDGNQRVRIAGSSLSRIAPNTSVIAVQPASLK